MAATIKDNARLLSALLTKRAAGDSAGALDDALSILEVVKVQRDKSRSRIAELEALVLSADTVSKGEYQQMVQQRDAMRQERNAARDSVAGLRASIETARADLEKLRKAPSDMWRLDEAIFELGGSEA